MTPVFPDSATLRQRLSQLMKAPLGRLPVGTDEPLDAVVVSRGVNHQHGTGSLLLKLFPDGKNCVCVRSQDRLPSISTWGRADLYLRHAELSRPEMYKSVAEMLGSGMIRRVVCVPYRADDLATAIALHDVCKAPVCTYIMDDNFFPADLIRELLEKSTLRLAISAEMRQAYEAQHGLRFWFVPPVLDADLIATQVRIPSGELAQQRTGVLVGNIWSQVWLEGLRSTLRHSGLRIHWYGNPGNAGRNFNLPKLREDGIDLRGFVPEPELAQLVREYPYAILPSGELDEGDSRDLIARYSLPSRIIFLQGAAHLPVIVLGSPDTAAARWVTACGTGVQTPYRREDFVRAVTDICRPERQEELRRRAAAQAPSFANTGLTEWLWDSLRRGSPADDRFERLVARAA